MKMWGGRFGEDTNALVEKYNASIEFDQTLALYDIQGSIAHARMLGKTNIISLKEAKTLESGLVQLHQKALKNELQYSTADEDIHMNIERLLGEFCGEVAGKLHSGRSRNDQVALDLHLYLRDHTIAIVQKIAALMQVLVELAKQHQTTLLPGYTHLQRAEPVRLSHHLLAYCQMLHRDALRLQDCFTRINCNPLGAGALAGSGLPVDRVYVTELLGFDSMYANSMDAVSDRDFVIEFQAGAAVLMMHLSRLSEELILWSSQEFGFIEFSDAFSTGSSMMPQKKNPDVCELARGKTGRVYGALHSILTTLKGLPLSYNKDMQEDKEGLFDTVETLEMTLSVYAPMLNSMKVNATNMRSAVDQDFTNATQLANYLVNKNVPFRAAHEISGQLVRYCLSEGSVLSSLPLEKMQNLHPEFSSDVYEWLEAESVVEAHQASGGTSLFAVESQLQTMQAQMEKIEQWVARKRLQQRKVLESLNLPVQ